jgi:hypothetical protein
LRRLVKDDVAGDDDALVDGVVAAVGFEARFIAHEDRLDAPIIQLLQTWVRDLHMCDAPKCPHIVDSGHRAMPGFIWHLAIERAYQSSIEDVDSCRHSLPPEVARECIRLQQTPHHVDDALIMPLDHPVLLWRIGGGELTLDAACNTPCL